jgi:hypothetical protein
VCLSGEPGEDFVMGDDAAGMGSGYAAFNRVT